MAKVQTSQAKANKTPVKKKGHKNPKSPEKSKNTYCILCRRWHLKHEAQEHMHSMLHHRELETVLGQDSFHECQACRASSMGLYEYAQHISTAQHKAKLKSLMSKHVKPLSLHKTLSRETISRILERNKTLKKEERKQRGKKKKKLKQIAGQMRAEMQQGALRKNITASRVLKLEISKKVNTRTLKQLQETHQKGRNNAVVKNKENKVFSLQRAPHRREITMQNQSGRLAGLSGEPDGRTWHQACVPDQFNQSTQQMRCDGNFSANNHCSKFKVDHSQTQRLVKRPHNTQEGAATDMPEQMSWPAIRQYDYYNRQYNGAIIFDQGQKESTGSSQPVQEGSNCPSNPASANGPVSAAPIWDIDVSAMLRQIRRALGVREPCRADREARKQSSEARVRVADRSTTRQAGTEKEQPSGAVITSVQPPQVSTPAPAAHSGVCPSAIAPVQPKQTTFKMTQEAAQHCEKRLAVAEGLSNSWERESQGALGSRTSPSHCTGKTTSTEPHLNSGHRVRIAHEPGKTQGGKEGGLKPTLNKLLTVSGARGKMSWREMYNEMKKNKQDKVQGMPRFGIELAKPPTNQDSSTQPQDGDLPLSEGFHWESIPDSPSGPHSTLPPPPQDTTDIDPNREVQSDDQLQEPGRAQLGGSSHTAPATSVKAEPNLGGESGGLRESSSADKRRHNTDDGISEKEPSGKKKRTKSNRGQDQMARLLAVSLREDELSHSLQDLDKSLVQARNTLQAAYTEVQRLLLLRQQFTAEVNGLRAKRIEILQEMQEGYSGASNVAEKATASSAGAAAAAVQPRHSPLPSSSAFTTPPNQQTPATTPAPSTAQPHPTALALSAKSVKQEICHPPTAGRASRFASSDTDAPFAPYAPLNQPVPLFPPDLLPPLLLRPTHLAAPTTAAAASTSASTRRERQTREGCVRTRRLAKEEAQPAESDSEEEAGGNLGKEQVKGRESTAEEPVPERGQNASAAAADHVDGNESDDSVKMMEPSNPVVIDIDESDSEDSPGTVSNVRVEFSSASTQTSQQNDDIRKCQLPLPVRDASAPAESVEDEEPSSGVFVNHAGPVHGLQVHEGSLYTCSGDNTARAYSLTNRQCQAVFEGHTNKVNCLLVSSLPNMPARLYTGSSDQTIRCYSIKSKKCLEQISLPDRVLCLHIAWNTLYAGLANGSVASYDLKTLRQLDVFECHGPRGASCLGTAQEGARRVLLVGSYDSTISVRDAKSGLLLRSLEGHTKTVLCMKVVNDLVFSGSSDTSVHAHNIHTGELVRIYKGHGHAVTSIVILGKVMVTACLDKLVRVYELQSHDRLQVYGGHSDMVMCMAVHRSVIYTGCYDGSVQAVKLNLMKNYCCWWQNCSLIFGMAEHLVQHLVRDHTSPNHHTVKCRWRGCHTFFATQQSVRQELPEHMRSHVDKDHKVQP
ncbi:zinc finger protein 106 isoform X2 [Xiphias gladius]|uniref:zinc finger protein 106 isoform X2 n=1 Tax=Xiphias gladius TaxID=8245 RepID=UPI001A98BE9E|nr:zinc finger protein 106 isoform X2 [Xiphias gladius]